MNRNELIMIAGKLYVSAIDHCFLTAIIATSAIFNLKKKRDERDNEYVSPKLLESMRHEDYHCPGDYWDDDYRML
jgi:hypothetical protein